MNYTLLFNPPTPIAKRASNATISGLPVAGRVFSPAEAILLISELFPGSLLFNVIFIELGL